jgi:hypothetical protein
MRRSMGDEKSLNSNEEKTTGFEKVGKWYGSLISYLEQKLGFERAVKRFDLFIAFLEKFYVFEKAKKWFEFTIYFPGRRSVFGFYIILVVLFGLWLLYAFYKKLIFAFHSF